MIVIGIAEAIKNEEKALVLIKKEGGNVKEYQETLDKMKSGK